MSDIFSFYYTLENKSINTQRLICICVCVVCVHVIYNALFSKMGMETHIQDEVVG